MCLFIIFDTSILYNIILFPSVLFITLKVEFSKQFFYFSTLILKIINYSFYVTVNG